MFNSVEELQYWSQKIIPTVFDDSLSYLESVERLKSIVKEMIGAIRILGESNKELTDKYKEVLKELERLQKTIDDFIKGYTIVDGSITLEKLADDVLDRIEELVIITVKDVAKFVMFGLDDEGYFNAYIPDTWDDITFSTTEKGELVLEY